jgi:hypothetical protein
MLDSFSCLFTSIFVLVNEYRLCVPHYLSMNTDCVSPITHLFLDSFDANFMKQKKDERLLRAQSFNDPTFATLISCHWTFCNLVTLWNVFVEMGLKLKTPRTVSLCLFSSSHCIARSSSSHGFWLPLWYLQTVRFPRILN